MQSGGATGPVSFTEIDCWARATGIDLLPWESLALRRLSVVFVREAERAKDPKRPAPWKPVVLDKKVISDGVLKVFKAMQKSRAAKRGS